MRPVFWVCHHSLLLCSSDLSSWLTTRWDEAPYNSFGHITLAFLLVGRQVACRSLSPHSRNPKWRPLCFIKICKHTPHSPFGCPMSGRRCFPRSLPWAGCCHLSTLPFQASIGKCQHWQYLRGHILGWATNITLPFSGTSVMLSQKLAKGSFIQGKILKLTASLLQHLQWEKLALEEAVGAGPSSAFPFKLQPALCYIGTATFFPPSSLWLLGHLSSCSWVIVLWQLQDLCMWKSFSSYKK